MGINLQKIIREKNAAKLNLAEEAARAQQPAGGTVSGGPHQPNALDVAREQNSGALNLQALRNQGAVASAPIGGGSGGGAGAGGALANALGDRLSGQDKNQASLNLQELMGQQDYSLQELKNQGAADVQRLENEGNKPYMGGEKRNAPGTTGPSTMATGLNLSPDSLASNLASQMSQPLAGGGLNLQQMNPHLRQQNQTYGGATLNLQQINPKLNQQLSPQEIDSLVQDTKAKTHNLMNNLAANPLSPGESMGTMMNHTRQAMNQSTNGGGSINLESLMGQRSGRSNVGGTPTQQQLEEDLMRRLGR